MGNDVPKEVGRSHVLVDGVGAFDRVVVRASPVAVPRCFGGPLSASCARLEGYVAGVDPRFGPGRADGSALKGGGGLSLVGVAEGLDDGVRDFEARGALGEALAAVVVSGALPKLGDEVVFKLPEG